MPTNRKIGKRPPTRAAYYLAIRQRIASLEADRGRLAEENKQLREALAAIPAIYGNHEMSTQLVAREMVRVAIEALEGKDKEESGNPNG